jgi:hypothetical protein
MQHNRAQRSAISRAGYSEVSERTHNFTHVGRQIRVFRYKNEGELGRGDDRRIGEQELLGVGRSGIHKRPTSDFHAASKIHGKDKIGYLISCHACIMASLDTACHSWKIIHLQTSQDHQLEDWTKDHDNAQYLT